MVTSSFDISRSRWIAKSAADRWIWQSSGSIKSDKNLATHLASRRASRRHAGDPSFSSERRGGRCNAQAKSFHIGSNVDVGRLDDGDVVVHIVYRHACRRPSPTVPPPRPFVTPTPRPTPTPWPTWTPQPTRTPIRPTPTRTPTPTLPPTVVSNCDSAFSKPASGGAFAAPALILLNQGKVWDPYRLPFIESVSSAEPKTLVCIKEVKTKVATYTGGTPGYRVDWDVRLVQASSGRVLQAKTFTGGDPPRVTIGLVPRSARKQTARESPPLARSCSRRQKDSVSRRGRDDAGLFARRQDAGLGQPRSEGETVECRQRATGPHPCGRHGGHRRRGVFTGWENPGSRRR